jgi:PAS domain S-box-containing protein
VDNQRSKANEVSIGVFEIFEVIFGAALRPIIVKDEQSRFVYLNLPACKLIGRKPGEVLGRSDHDFLSKAAADQIRAMDEEIIRSGESRLFEEIITIPDGDTRRFLTHKRRADVPIAGGVAQLVIAIIEDVTDLRRAEQVLRASEEHYRSLIELHPHTPWVANANGEVLELGPEWEQASGRRVRDALGSGWASALHPEDLRGVQETWARCVASGTPFDLLFRIGTPSGEYRWYRSRAAARKDDQGRVLKWYGLLEDVHDRQLALQALQASEQRLRQHSEELEKVVDARTAEVREKNAELDRLLQQERAVNALQRRFVAMISHEFRTPLSVIDAAAQRIARTKTAITPEFLLDKSVQIRGATTRMVELMESILAAGRLETGTITIAKRPCSLADVIRECAARRAEISNSHKIQLQIDNLPPTVSADTDALERVFSNLLSNAVKYSPNSSDIHLRGWMEGASAFVSVKDSGIGMDSDDLPKLFQPYFRARSSTGIAGTGIGLNIVREILEMHGGHISVSSTLGQGTTFTVALPIGASEEQQKVA